MFVVYTEIDGGAWYYGRYSTEERASDVVSMLGEFEHGYVDEETARGFVLNMPKA